ncbi:MAG: class I SAM-dependent methyltransferase [Candidatus Dormibacteria bacterium]
MEYDATYFTEESPENGHRDFLSPWAQHYDEVRFGRELDDFLPRPGILLDVGAATGSFLSIAATRGWHSIGVEVSEAARAIAASHGHHCVATMQEARDFGPFDAVTMHHVLEHLDDPVAVIRDALSMLRPEGRLLIEVPNWASLERRACGAAWVDLRPEQHLRQFEPATLRRVLIAAGARVELITTLGSPMPTSEELLTAIGAPLPAVRRLAGAAATVQSNHAFGNGGDAAGGRTRQAIKARIARWQERLLAQRWGKRLVAIATP